MWIAIVVTKLVWYQPTSKFSIWTFVTKNCRHLVLGSLQRAALRGLWTGKPDKMYATMIYTGRMRV